MVDIEDIPVELRWRLVSRTVMYLPFAYDLAFRDLAGNAYDERARTVYAGLAGDTRAIAAAFGMPMHNAAAIAETVGVVNAVLYGPGFETEFLEADGESALLRTIACPMLAMVRTMGIDPEHALDGCVLYNRALVEDLNPDYTLRPLRGMCTGDEFCEMKIEKKT